MLAQEEQVCVVCLDTLSAASVVAADCTVCNHGRLMHQIGR